MLSLCQILRESGLSCSHLAAQEDQLCCRAHHSTPSVHPSVPPEGSGRKLLALISGMFHCQVHNMIQFMDPERVRAQLDRILVSAEFADAERASNFLRFVVLRALAGRTGEIKESVIAVDALGRSPSFDSKSDAIVRVEAKRLRDRLDSYYRSEGAGDRVTISLPKGGYVPEFLERQPMALPPPGRKRSPVSHAGWALFGLTALALLSLSRQQTPPFTRSRRLFLLPPGRHP